MCVWSLRAWIKQQGVPLLKTLVSHATTGQKRRQQQTEFYIRFIVFLKSLHQPKRKNRTDERVPVCGQTQL